MDGGLYYNTRRSIVILLAEGIWGGVGGGWGGAVGFI